MLKALAANLAIFVFLTSLPAFQSVHHHWILSALASAFGLQYAFLRYVGRGRWAWAARAETTLLWLLALLLLMGIVRHRSILDCFDRCALKLSGAAAIAAWVFLLHGSRRRPGFWDPLRCRLAAAGAFLWSLYLALLGFQLAPWVLDGLFFILALVLWLGRGKGLFFIVALGILGACVARVTGSEPAVISLNIAWIAALLAGGGHRIEAWVERRVPQAPEKAHSRPRRLAASAARIALAVAVTAGLGAFVMGPMETVTQPDKRRARLRAAASGVRAADPAALSPLARRLRGHVVRLAGTIGERAAYLPKEQRAARDYVAASLRAAGYEPRVLEYGSEWMLPFKNGTPFHNVEAVLPGAAGGGGVFIVGAHYDTSAGTPGADDNASGVAVLLEAARLLRSRRPAAEMRFVAFGTEEPPAFGTQNMGSSRYARRLRAEGAKVRGMISLEMLGYFNPKPGAQLYPPFLHLFYPTRGDFVSVVGNWGSRALLRRFQRGWKEASSFPLEGAVLPGALSSLALSDQLNFWAEGYPALMLSDTAFYRNPHYHQHTDTPETLDYEKMAAVTEGLVAALAAAGAD